MSATAIDHSAAHAPVQLGFIEALPDAESIRIALHGQLARQPHVRRNTDGDAHILVHLRAPEGDLPVYAVCHVPPELRAHAELQVLGMRPGQVVMLVGRRLALSDQHGIDYLELRECASISQVEIQQ